MGSFPGGSVVKNPVANARDTGEPGSILESGRWPGVGNGNPLQYSCLENSVNIGAWQATVSESVKSQTCLSTHTHNNTWRNRTIWNTNTKKGHIQSHFLWKLKKITFFQEICDVCLYLHRFSHLTLVFTRIRLTIEDGVSRIFHVFIGVIIKNWL